MIIILREPIEETKEKLTVIIENKLIQSNIGAYIFMSAFHDCWGNEATHPIVRALPGGTKEYRQHEQIYDIAYDNIMQAVQYLMHNALAFVGLTGLVYIVCSNEHSASKISQEMVVAA